MWVLNMSFSCDALSLSKCSGVARSLFPLNNYRLI
jgi:hypothetical protein